MKYRDFNADWIFYKKWEPKKAVKVCLPHDAMLSEPRIPHLTGGENSGYFPGGTYVYEKELLLPPENKGQTVLLDFDGVYQKSAVFLNGEKVGGHIYGYSNFYVDLTEKIQYDSVNKIRVEVDNTQTPNSRWYTGSGIYREVKLITGSKCHILPEGIKIQTISLQPAVIEVFVETSDSVEQGKNCLQLELYRKDTEKTVQSNILKTDVQKIGCRYVFSYQIQIDNPQLWNAESPILYQLRAKLLKNGEQLDEASTTFGLRCLTWGAETGLCCNGHEIKLRGACIHHDNGMLGACEFRDAVYRKIRILKEVGYNAVRTAHNPPSRLFLQACDELGMYVMAEFTDVWEEAKNPYDYSLYFQDEWEADVQAMVRKLYNHPSVILYSVGNEISDLAKTQGAATVRCLAERFHQLDTTRPVTVCSNILSAMMNISKKPLKSLEHTAEEKVNPCRAGKDAPLVGSKLMNMIATFLPTLIDHIKPQQVEKHWKPIMEPLDLMGFNYGMHLAEPLHALNPKRLLVHSETYPSSIGKTWPVTLRCKHVIGDFMWAGWDYLGEVGIGVVEYGKQPLRMNKPYPCVSSGVGSVNLAGEIEAQGHFTQIVYGQCDEPYIAVHPVPHAGQKRRMSRWRGTDAVNSWSWNGCEGMLAQIDVYSSASEVELLHDYKSLGRQKVVDFSASFQAVYRPGILEALAYDASGTCVGRSQLRTASETTLIAVEADRQTMSANGSDLVFLSVALTDENGIVKVLENRRIDVKVTGCAQLQAVGSGSPWPCESFTAAAFTTYYGRMIAVVRSTRQAGAFTVTFSTEGLPDASIQLATNESET